MSPCFSGFAAPHRSARGTEPSDVGSYALRIARKRPEPTASLDGDVAGTGVAELDEVVGGLFWGDNVVFEVAEGATAEPFYRAVAGSDIPYDRRLLVRLEDRLPAFDGFDVIDAAPGTNVAEPTALLRAVYEACQGAERNLLLFDGLEAMAARWGADVAAGFFARCCPQLLDIGAIAYWFVPAADDYVALRRTVEEVTQCIFRLDQERLRVAKADGRPPGVEGSVFHCSEVAGLPVLTPAPVVARVGAALRAARLQRNLSQSALARLAGVSPSAISQSERGQRGLSLETVLQLATGLNVTLDELLRGEVPSGYRLGRRRYPPRRRAAESGEPLPLLDDPQAGVRAYLVRLPRRGSGEPHISHKGVELITVASGLVQVLLGTGRPVLRGGEALVAEETQIAGWRNLGVGEAALFWILRDSRHDA